MLIIPAIDLKDGTCVRLVKGEFETAHRVAEDAVETARGFLEAGASLVHMVDLDGALTGRGKNRAVVRDVIRKTGARVELGGGIRTMEDLEAVFALGVVRAVLGSAAVENPGLVEAAVKRFGARIAVGIDARGGAVRTRGWREGTGVDYVDFARRMEGTGVGTIIFTDIDSDGTLQGPAVERLAALRLAVSCAVVASGGVTTPGDVEILRDMGIDAAIVGKALYAGALDLKEAVRLAERGK
ncbi:MAG TPA: 1-(5-phosphoribosyl)-5-[(5-phosphoribosylamino)methylideneamino]imidazole-4-carboxamide isomerase [Oscillospiraceae bacterium]|nr:1-(5-phosphoribosyl)-5-[(5-phosphoribosylamino)methylideneamino]imidazole-4-carboxamide isomerase [Oscillospiraceae bacterium]